MRQHENKTRYYFEATSRLIGRPTMTRLFCRTSLEGATIRDVVLMGPNARRISPSTFDEERGSLTVTFDIVLLLARKPGAGDGGFPVPGRTGDVL
jgi:hypothetical protein